MKTQNISGYSPKTPIGIPAAKSPPVRQDAANTGAIPPRDVINANCNRTAIPAADLEPDTRHAPVAAQATARLDSPVAIRVISYRARKHDPDGVSVKAVLDGIVRSGILADDSTEQIKSITFESRKSKEERTVIEIEEIEL